MISVFMRSSCARTLLPHVRDRSWFFDTELLVLAERSGLRIAEVPVDWVDDPDSRVDIVSTAVADLRGIARLGRALVRREVPLHDVRAQFGRRSLDVPGHRALRESQPDRVGAQDQGEARLLHHEGSDQCAAHRDPDRCPFGSQSGPGGGAVDPACAGLELDSRGRAAPSSALGVGRTAHFTAGGRPYRASEAGSQVRGTTGSMPARVA